MNIQILENLINDCKDCGLHETCHNKVFGEGNLSSPLLIIGEAPGANEDMEGRPFIGKAGKFLDECLKEGGLDRSQIFITNIMKCRPCIIQGKTNKNRPPTSEETAICNKWLEEQINIIKPKVILTLGAPSTKFILNQKNVKMTEIRGHFFKTDYAEFVMPSLHPSYILTYKGEAEKQMLISDIKSCVMKLKEIGSEPACGEIYTHKTFDLFSN